MDFLHVWSRFIIPFPSISKKTAVQRLRGAYVEVLELEGFGGPVATRCVVSNGFGALTPRNHLTHEGAGGSGAGHRSTPKTWYQGGSPEPQPIEAFKPAGHPDL